MFYIFNKQKIYSYLVASGTVAVLLFGSIFFMGSANVSSREMTAGVEKLVPIYSVETSKQRIAVTINCAWNADDIDQILDVLERCNVKATFFMVGDWVDKFPESVKKIADAGHQIGNHSNTHPHVNNLSYEENVEEIVKCSDKIKALTGNDVKLYRAPYGEYNNTVIQAATDKGYQTIQWSIDTLDYEGLNEEQMWDRINKNLKNGSIILMHNGTENTASSLEGIIKNIQSKGYNIVKLSDLVYSENYIIDANGMQKSNV